MKSNEWTAVFISIHAPPRGATNSIFTFDANVLFQFTPLREGRRSSSTASKVSGIFQFTPLREGRPRQRVRENHHHYFNSRPSARGDFKEEQP